MTSKRGDILPVIRYVFFEMMKCELFNNTLYSKSLKTLSSFYRETFSAMIITRRKGIANIENWDIEHVFYNPLLVNKESGKTFTLTKYFDDKSIYTLGHFFDENGNKRLNLPYDRSSVNLYQKLRTPVRTLRR